MSFLRKVSYLFNPFINPEFIQSTREEPETLFGPKTLQKLVFYFIEI